MDHAITRSRRAWAVVGSLLFPGAGHLVLGRLGRGVAWMGGMLAANLAVAACAAFADGRLAVAAMLLGAVGLGLGGRVAAVLDVVLSRRAATASTRWGLVLGGWAAVFALSAGEGAALRRFVVEAFHIPAGSMLPTLVIGDDVLASPLHAPARGDVIVFRSPQDPRRSFVKRVLGVGGDEVSFRDDGTPVLGGVPVARTPRGETTCRDRADDTGAWTERRALAFDETLDGRTWTVLQDPEDRSRAHGPVRVAPGHFFVVGDNRDNSYDSRFMGLVPAHLVVGPVRVVYLSWGRDGLDRSRIGRTVR